MQGARKTKRDTATSLYFDTNFKDPPGGWNDKMSEGKRCIVHQEGIVGAFLHYFYIVDYT